MKRTVCGAALGIFSALAAPLAFVGPAAAGSDQFDVAFGAAVTSDYISRGISQTDGKPAVQGYVELDYNILYASAWASNVDFGKSDAEIDLAVGMRPTTDSADFDLGYVQYVYANDSSPTYGEIYGIANFYATDSLTVGGDVYFAPDYSQEGASAAFLEATADYSLPANFGISGAIGHQGFADSLDLPDYWTWNAGVYWTWKDTLTVDLRYTDSNLSKDQCETLMSRSACGPRFMATLSIDTSVSALTGKN